MSAHFIFGYCVSLNREIRLTLELFWSNKLLQLECITSAKRDETLKSRDMYTGILVVSLILNCLHRGTSDFTFGSFR